MATYTVHNNVTLDLRYIVYDADSEQVIGPVFTNRKEAKELADGCRDTIVVCLPFLSMSAAIERDSNCWPNPYYLNIDGKLLREQRRYIDELLYKLPENDGHGREMLAGLQSLLDELADQAKNLYGIDSLLTT